MSTYSFGKPLMTNFGGCFGNELGAGGKQSLKSWNLNWILAHAISSVRGNCDTSSQLKEYCWTTKQRQNNIQQCEIIIKKKISLSHPFCIKHCYVCLKQAYHLKPIIDFAPLWIYLPLLLWKLQHYCNLQKTLLLYVNVNKYTRDFSEMQHKPVLYRTSFITGNRLNLLNL